MRRIQTDQSSPLCQDIPSLPNPLFPRSTRTRGACLQHQKLSTGIQTHRAPQRRSKVQPALQGVSPQCICLANADISLPAITRGSHMTAQSRTNIVLPPLPGTSTAPPGAAVPSRELLWSDPAFIPGWSLQCKQCYTCAEVTVRHGKETK